MPVDDSDEIRQELQNIVDRLEEWRARKAMPDASEELEEMLARAQKLVNTVADWHSHQLDERRTSAWLEAMNASHATLLKAINANMKVTNELLKLSVAIEDDRRKRAGGAFRADQEVIDEGAYLYEVLAIGAQGTEAGGPLLRPWVVVPYDLFNPQLLRQR